jgi:golgin subfamily B member 1
MPEHTIPETLIDQIKQGRAAIVVGAGIGVPSWKQLLERMTRELQTRGRDGDEAATKDLGKLLHKGSLVRAVGFLARALGEEACDRIVEEMWRTPEPTPELARVLARLPVRHVWTTFPGDLLERAFEEHLPEGWPLPRLATWQQLGELSRRRRTLVKMLGNFDSYVVTPTSVRRALSGAVDLRDYARDFYVEGALVFVGFRFGDPDLAALLDRVFGVFEPPRGAHYFLGAGMGPVTVDELMADHHIEVVNLAGKSGDDMADKAVLEWLERLELACRDAGISLAQATPDADDLDGWLALLAEGQKEAADAVDLIERRAREADDAERLTEVLLGRVELADEPRVRAELLRQLADVYENGAGDLKRAFEALTTALHVDPADDDAAAAAERLAAATGSWADLVGEASELTTEVTDPVIASRWWARLGRWYADKLDRFDYATPSLRRALELDAANRAAHVTFAEVLRKQNKWAELADALRAHVVVEPDAGEKLDLYIALGDLCESHLASTAKAIEAYQAAVDLDPDNDDALAALERLYRRDERWGNLAKVLERRAELLDTQDKGRAAAIRRELATLRADKLGDLEGAIARYEAALDKDPAEVAALQALEDLYEKTGRTEEYLRTLERLITYAPEGEKLVKLRKLASELEDRDGAAGRARAAYEKILDLEPHAEDAFRGLGRLLAADGKWYEVVALVERHIASARSPAQKLELYLENAQINERELADPHRAIECYLNALAIDETCRPALVALARLYQRTEAWDRAVQILVRHAELEGNRGAAEWAEAGRIAYEHEDDAELAERHLEKALSIDPAHLGALRNAARLHQARGAWARAVDHLLRAEEASSSRLERVEILVEAAELVDGRLEDPERALELLERVLKLDPDHVEAGEKVADRLVANGRWEDALGVLEMLARRAEHGDRLERARREAQLGKAYEELHRHEKAARHYRIAVEADPDSLDAALGLAGMLMAEAAASPDQAPAAREETWKEVDRRYREVLARHRTGLADGQVADIWYRLGETARALGDDRKAENALRRALERDPLHEPTLQALVEIAGARGDWKTVVEAKRSLVAAVAEPLKVKLLDEIGDLWRHKLRDASTAVGAYLEALELAPGSHVLLHKLLDAYTEQRQWRRAVEALDQLSSRETAPPRRAKYHYAAAVIARDEIGDVELAVERFAAALDDAPETPKAFEAIDKLLTDKQDWKNLVRAYRKHLKRLGEDADTARLLELWTRLGDLCLDQLGDAESAIAAYEVASSLAPEDLARHEQLADLYLEAGEPRRAEAIEELQVLLGHAPDRVELYKALADLYRQEHMLDKAWCLAQALVFLGAASEEEKRLYERHRPAQFQPAARRLTEELWQKAIIHPHEDRAVGAIFASTLGGLVALTAQPAHAFGLDAHQRADLEGDPRPVTRVVKYATGVLSLDPAPMVWLQREGDGLRVANTIAAAAGGAERGKLVPSLLVGPPYLDKGDERELAFEVGKRLAYLRPERFVTFALGSLPKLEAAFAAAILASGAPLDGGADAAGEARPAWYDEARRLAESLRATVPGAMLDQVSHLAGKLGGRASNGLIAAWRTATDLTANRVGLILANDLETAARLVATETGAMSTLAAKERLRDLLAFSVSEGYFAVRRHLGVHVREEASA